MSPASSQCSCQGGTTDGAAHHRPLLASLCSSCPPCHSHPPGMQGSSPGDGMTQSRLEVTKAIGFMVAEQAASSGDSAVRFALTGLAATPEDAALQPRSCSAPRASSAPTAPAMSPA